MARATPAGTGRDGATCGGTGDFAFTTTGQLAATGDDSGAGVVVGVAHSARPHLQQRQTTFCSMRCGATLATACIQTNNNPINVASVART